MIREFLTKIGWKNYSIFNPNLPQAFNIELSGKLMALRELLQECQIGEQTEKDSLGNDSGLESPLTEMPNLCQHRALIFCKQNFLGLTTALKRV